MSPRLPSCCLLAAAAFVYVTAEILPVAFAVEAAVAERQDEVGCDHENVGNVKKHHIA